MILVTLTLKLLVDCIHNYFSTGKYKKLVKLFSRKKRKLTLDSYFKKGMNIISKKGRGVVPWFLLTGDSEKNSSLLKDINVPVFHSNELNCISNNSEQFVGGFSEIQAYWNCQVRYMTTRGR